MDKAVQKELLNKLKAVDLDFDEEQTLPEINFVSTGFDSFDYEILGTGGLPVGRIIQVYGPEGSGKTLLALRAIAMIQRKHPDMFVAYLDTEYTFDPVWAKRQGVNLETLRLIQSNIAEEVLGAAVKFAASGACSGIVIDSVGNLMPNDDFSITDYYKQNKKGEFEHKVQPGVMAKKTTAFIRQMAKFVFENKVLCIAVNQVRDRIGVLHGDPTDTPGGRALKHNLTLNIGLSRVEDLINDKSKEVEGVKIKARVKKSKVAIAKTTDETNHLRFYFDGGIEKTATISLFDEAVRKGVILRSGPWVTWVEGKEVKERWQGRDNALAQLLSDDELRETLANDVARSGNQEPIPVEPSGIEEGIELLP